MTTRTNISLPDDMHLALLEEADKQGKPMAWLVREAIGAMLAQNGRVVKTAVEWGGYREKGASNE